MSGKNDDHWSHYQPPPNTVEMSIPEKPKPPEHEKESVPSTLSTIEHTDFAEISESSPDELPPPKPPPPHPQKPKHPPENQPKIDDDDSSDSDEKPQKPAPKKDKGQLPPPPPIIGPDGEEVPRPRDAQGNPLPIYMTPEGKPIFDAKGKPIPVMFDKGGRPIPLDYSHQQPSKNGGSTGGEVETPTNAQTKKKFVSDWVFWVGVSDMIISLMLLCYFINSLALVVKRKEGFRITGSEKEELNLLITNNAAAIASLILGVIFASLPMFAEKKNLPNLTGIWCFTSTLLLLAATLISYMQEVFLRQDFDVLIVYSFFRLFFALLIACVVYENDDEEDGVAFYAVDSRGGVHIIEQRYPSEGQPISTVPPRPQQSQQQTIISQQPQPVMSSTMTVYPTASRALMMPVYYPSYGYGYPGYALGYGAGLGMYGGW